MLDVEVAAEQIDMTVGEFEALMAEREQISRGSQGEIYHGSEYTWANSSLSKQA